MTDLDSSLRVPLFPLSRRSDKPTQMKRCIDNHHDSSTAEESPPTSPLPPGEQAPQPSSSFPPPPPTADAGHSPPSTPPQASLYDSLIIPDNHPQGHRLHLLPFLTTKDLLSLSACSKACLPYRAFLSRVKLVRRQPANGHMKTCLVALLRAVWKGVQHLTIQHLGVLQALKEVASSSGCCLRLKTLSVSCMEREKGEDEHVSNLSQILGTGAFRHLEELNISFPYEVRSSSDYRAPPLAPVFEALADGACPNLRLLSFPFLSSVPAMALARCLSSGHCSHVEKLDFTSCLGYPIGTLSILDAIKQGGCPNLRYLDLTACILKPRHGQELGEALRLGACRKLKYLCLHENEFMEDVGVAAVVRGLAAEGGWCPHLQTLILGDTWMGESGIVALAQALAAGHWPHLQELDLSWNSNSVEEEWLVQVLRALSLGQHGELRSLGLVFAGAMEVAGEILLEALRLKAWPHREELYVTVGN